jgi:hypothetical protein
VDDIGTSAALCHAGQRISTRLEELVKRAVVALLAFFVSVPALAQTSLLPTVQRFRADYPTPMSSAQRGELLNRVAWEHRADGWGLLIKTGGNRCAAPQGVEVACDILVHAPTRWHFDVLIDSEGSATPTWGDVGPCDPSVSGCSMDRFLAPIAPAGAPPVPTGEFARFVGGDFDGNGLGDLLAQRGGGSVMLGLNAGSSFQTQSVFDSATTWSVVGVGNFDRVGNPDVVWQNASGTVVLWAFNTSSTHQGSFLFSGSSVWRIVAVTDIDLDTFPDLIWQAPSGQVVAWLMQGTAVKTTHVLYGYSSPYKLVATGDFNGDGSADIVWQHPTTGQVAFWLMQGLSILTNPMVFNGATVWQVVAASDVDGNGRSDLIWRGPAGYSVVWLMNGAAQAGAMYLTLGSQWLLSATP